MKIYIPVAVILCGVITSCTSQKRTTSKSMEESCSSTNLTFEMQQQLALKNSPSMNLYILVWGYKEINKCYPETIIELKEHYTVYPSEPRFDPEGFKDLTITPGKNNTLIFSWENTDPSSNETLIFDLQTDKASTSLGSPLF